METETFRQAETEPVKQGFLFRRGFGDPGESDLSRPSVVGRTRSALCSVDSRVSAFLGDSGCVSSIL